MVAFRSLSSALTLGLLWSLGAAATEQAPAKPAPAVAQVPAVPATPLAASAPSARPADAGAVARKAAPPADPAPARVSDDPHPSLGPTTFTETMRAAERYRAIAESGGWPALPAGTALKEGDRGGLVATLRRRLAATGDIPDEAEPSPVFDAALASGLKRFQARHGLTETGAIGRRTLAALNVPAAIRARQLEASLHRMMGSTFPFGPRYVVVNIPAATVEAVENGSVVRRYVAVVGRKDRPSPRLAAHIAAVNLNPLWTVPASIIRRDIIPEMRKDKSYLAKAHIRILDGRGQEIEPAAIDWSTEKAANYTLRQDPGAANSLGQVRIDMPNRQAVYLHDTPKKRLFALDARFHSSGCVRVADVRGFAAWLLAGTPGPNGAWTRADLDAAIATGEHQDLKLARAVPVAWVYLTGYATSDGTVQFRDDIYGLDVEPADAAIAAAVPSAAPARSASAPLATEPVATTGSLRRPPSPDGTAPRQPPAVR